MPLSHWLRAIADELGRPGITVEVVVERANARASEPQLVPSPEVRHAFVNLIDNALRFARTEVDIGVLCGTEMVEVRIEDDGPGFPPEVLAFLGEPYLSSGREGAGLGLGVFIAQTLLARTGATLQFENLEAGASVVIRWRADALEDDAPET
jgi:two-component system sensor histidine kinase RegB